MAGRRHLVFVVTAAIVLVLCLLAQAQQEPPPTKVEVIRPAPGSEAAGLLDVRVMITPPEGVRAPAVAYAGFNGPPWREMDRVGETDEWRARLDSTLIPNGTRKIVVVTDSRHARGESSVVIENPMKQFFADLHSHTACSDGALIPADAHEYARDVAKLDVFALTDHLEYCNTPEWADIRGQAFKANDEGAFVCLTGLEWTKKLGHACIFDPGMLRWPSDLPGFYKALARADAVAKFNHPGDGSKVFDGLAYSGQGDRSFQMMEVRNADEEKAYLRALDLGWHIAPDGSDDTHAPNWGNCRSWTVIMAPGLSQRNIWDALRNRRLYSTRDRSCLVDFRVNGALMGAIVEEPVRAADVVVAVDEADPGDEIARIDLFQDGAVVRTDEPGGDSRRWATRCTPGPGRHYYFARVTQADGDLIWTAPVWIIVSEQ